MALCTRRTEGFGPTSHLYNHILASCFLDVILVPLCTWLYFLALLSSFGLCLSHQGTRRSLGRQDSDGYNAYVDANTAKRQPLWPPWKGRSKIYTTSLILYYLLIIAQFLMCILEIVRLSLAQLGIGLLPFTFVALIVGGSMRASMGLRGKVMMWRWLNVGLWVALAITNSVKIAQEVKEGTAARKGSKYPVVDQLTDVSVMVGVYTVLAMLEIGLQP
ncbi:hypothetical protein G7Y79_00014g036850 [Physcia stellaris]|nr:hypothetical protein G7Y79_00014g036850 [Physcia stellaris]